MALTTVSNNALSNITAIPASIPTGALTLIKSITASSSASISFVDGTDGVVLDDTYQSYVFKFINIHPATDEVKFTVGFRDGGTAYDATKTTTSFVAYHNEADDNTNLQYRTDRDLAQSTDFQILGVEIGNANDENLAGELTIFSPSSTVFVKHFIATTQLTAYHDFCQEAFTAGYCNVTAAIDGVQFKMTSGNIDDGIIKLYGVK